ncbi:single-stranded-DNA-specific exonuclease RecJ [Sulfurimonas lithotrophica]|uniref:Single-stranded-DNA-specific exonuclease RecJ n=1 Tax=Sulfurimonas lithotrophica TaxID=2590022 RepID=A0A5P8NXT3_9BACT|nr:single-stranded-DNA-specific exonuclease RecJ [Sulfurimonas lithotrophica]QFR48216.1 single-stranded-DNA-specific exonuclease RecJ [Sulfurimonas lithotrophica]
MEILNKQKIFELLSSRFDEEKTLSQIPNPSLLKDADKAASRIAKAIKNNEKITLVGDYDVDGISATAIMCDFFAQIPYPLDAVIPNRFNDGYGVSPTILNRIDADLVISVDNGITAIEAADICKERGIDLIITDHHTPGEILPRAYAIVDPKLKECQYPFKEICGAQVAWLLLGLLKRKLSINIDMKQFLDILTIAIIADVMPLININRLLVKEGLKVLMNSSRPASVIIKDFINKPYISSEDIAFAIAPRINAAGRLEDASIALNFFRAKDVNIAYNYFNRLNNLNEQRKETEAYTTKQATASVNKNDKIIVVAGEDWHEGVVGIVASRLTDKFGRPSIVLNIEDKKAKGSARSIGEVDIYKLLAANNNLLNGFGGHKMAAGLSIDKENIYSFTKAINESAKNIPDSCFLPKDDVLGILDSSSIDIELLNIFDMFEPYGEANKRPTFLIQNAYIEDIKIFGREKNHSKIIIRQNKDDLNSLELTLFREVFEMPQNKKITCSYTVNKNIWNNRISTQLLINKIYI